MTAHDHSPYSQVTIIEASEGVDHRVVLMMGIVGLNYYGLLEIS